MAAQPHKETPMFTVCMFALWFALGYLILASVVRILSGPIQSKTKRLAASASIVTGALLLLIPSMAVAAPWYEREPFAGPVSYVLGTAVVAGVAWLGGLFGKSKKLDIAAANRAALAALEAQLQALMLQAIAAVEERAAAQPLSYKSKDKRNEALMLFQQSLPKGVTVPKSKADVMLDAALVTAKIGAAAKKVG